MSKLVEEWRDIAGYEGLYQVSDWGNVRSLNYKHTGKVKNMSPQKSKGGYSRVLINFKKMRKQCSVHRLVAEAFIPNPENKEQVDHIIPISNGGTNEVWNLRWATAGENSNNPLTKENKKYPHTKEQHDKIAKALSKSVIQMTLDNQFIREWNSTKEIERELGFNHWAISACCRGIRKTHKGFIWRYSKDISDSHPD